MTEGVTDWPPADIERYRQAGYWGGITFDEFLTQQAEKYGQRIAVVDDRTRLSYAELAERAARLGAGLSGLGIKAGDRVLVQLPNRAEFLVSWFALQRIGAVPIHTQPGHRRSEIMHLAELSGAVAYIIKDQHGQFDFRVLAAEAMAGSFALEHVIVIGDTEGRSGFVSYDEVASAPLPDQPVERTWDSRELALLLLSGGTTGTPKLIPRTHDDYLYNSRAAAKAAGLGEDTVYMAALPVAFNYTMNCPGVLGALVRGGKVVLADNPDPAYCFALIEREGVTITAINPQLAPIWLEEAEWGSADISSLRVIQVGSARLAEVVAHKMIDQLDARLQQAFGMAEGLLCLSPLDDSADLAASTQGVPISEADEIRVVGEDGKDVAEGEVGELLTRGPYTLRGYYDAPDHNRRSFTEDGFYCSGDLVRRLPSGHVAVVGRAKDQINRGGEKIAAAEVEGHLLAHPAIRSVGLVGAPDEQFGERSVAFIEAIGQERPTKRELTAFLLERGVAGYKSPDQVEFVTEMPLTPVGKIDKKILAARLDTSGSAKDTLVP